MRMFTKDNMRLEQTLQPQADNNHKLSKRLRKQGCFFSHQANFHLRRSDQDDERYMALSDGGHQIMNTPNAGGNSVVSEVTSFELLRRLIRARLSKTEMDIRYNFPEHSKKTDYVVTVPQPDGTSERQIAISVTRAMQHSTTQEYSYEHAERLIHKKLLCVLFSNRNVLKRDRWAQQVLHILTDDVRKARLLKKAFKRADPELKRGVVVICSVTKNARFVYVRDQYMNQHGLADGVVESDSDYDDEYAARNCTLYVPSKFCSHTIDSIDIPSCTSL
eukprot:TRINITY_DN19102_c0_g1_i1.p1 TRINITY_DN19102_c0_g1~~TRINITY_DN19102_c0_g1_i1.p1  ORF type:complete len:276 (-),score=55.03 TRINITY_DN19102_c0_g1_i1:142-969(-)